MQKSETTFKSSRISLKFGNAGKRKAIKAFLEEYRRVVSEFVNIFWSLNEIPTLPPSNLTSKVNTWLSARATQCAGKQASGIVRGCLKKQNDRLYMIGKLKSEGKLKRARKLQKIYDSSVISKPSIGNVEAQLDSRFVKVDWNNHTSFDGWLTLSSLGNKIKITIPIKKTTHFNKLLDRGVVRPGIRLSNKSATFVFEIPKTPILSSGKTLGVDIGLIDTLTCSDGQVIVKDDHGHSYQSICQKIARKKKGSKGFARAMAHRTNFLHWAINQLDLSEVSVLQRENIRDLRKYKRNNRIMQAWNYSELFKVLDGRASDLGVRVKKLNPSYTSQRCSCCGWTWRGNRKGKLFKCAKCGHTQDADLNASLNLSFDLEVLSSKVHLKHPNRSGFYWNVLGREHIVPVV
jgi:IS605 OrfB family transposase